MLGIPGYLAAAALFIAMIWDAVSDLFWVIGQIKQILASEDDTLHVRRDDFITLSFMRFLILSLISMKTIGGTPTSRRDFN